MPIVSLVQVLDVIGLNVSFCWRLVRLPWEKYTGVGMYHRWALGTSWDEGCIWL